MIKLFKVYFIIGALLHGGHFILHQYFPDKVLLSSVFYVQSVILLVFILSDLFIHFGSTFFKVYKGQLFLLSTTVKILATSTYFLVLKLVGAEEFTKVFVLMFMFSYFVYLFVETVTLFKTLNSETS
jgi:hypothetical protein